MDETGNSMKDGGATNRFSTACIVTDLGMRLGRCTPTEADSTNGFVNRPAIRTGDPSDRKRNVRLGKFSGTFCHCGGDWFTDGAKGA
jgi:hypothetical protein